MTEEKIKDMPTGKKIYNMISKIRIGQLDIKNEHELELVVWGALCGRWSEYLKWRKEIGGRLCDIGLMDIAVEIKYIKRIDDKDRTIGQVQDYLKRAKEVVIVCIDPKDYMNQVFDDNRIILIKL